VSYSGVHRLTPLPSPPSLTDVSTFDIKAQVFLDALPDMYCTFYTEKQWVCLYCRTHTSLLAYRKNGGKSCYNCGSNQGEIK